MTEATQRTSDSGVSIWLDDLSRSRIESGSLQDLIANKTSSASPPTRPFSRRLCMRSARTTRS